MTDNRRCSQYPILSRTGYNADFTLRGGVSLEYQHAGETSNRPPTLHCLAVLVRLLSFRRDLRREQFEGTLKYIKAN